MSYLMGEFDVAVVGAGHAGVEAARFLQYRLIRLLICPAILQ